VLKSDIRKFFPSIDHELLKAEFRWKIKCPKTLWLMDKIVDNSNTQEAHIAYFEGDDLFTPYQRRHGLPIGNLTSQWWGNMYLNRFDHYMTEELKVGGYIRYVDDFVIFENDKARLWEIKRKMTAYLAQLRLLPHSDKTHIHVVEHGVPFLGFKVTPQYRVIKRENTKRYFRFLGKKMKLRRLGLLSPRDLENGLNAWLGHVRFGQNGRLENRVFRYLRVSGVAVFVTYEQSWRVLERVEQDKFLFRSR
jgi:retron-type reverse transcriptase